jgi:hypothetical protein
MRASYSSQPPQRVMYHAHGRSLVWYVVLARTSPSHSLSGSSAGSAEQIGQREARRGDGRSRAAAVLHFSFRIDESYPRAFSREAWSLDLPSRRRLACPVEVAHEDVEVLHSRWCPRSPGPD